MPELPEVETVKSGLQPLCVGQSITQLHIHQPKLRWPIPEGLAQRVQGHTIQQLTRRGKYLLFDFPVGTVLMHLGMTGICRVLPQSTPLAKHDHVVFEFGNGESLRFNDSRRFGAILWTEQDPMQHELLRKLGPEPLSDAFDGAYLYQKTRQRRVAMKQWLMNSHHVVGVGNIYANESLFVAGIHPQRLAQSLSEQEATALVNAIKTILAAAIKAGGTTLRDFKNTQGKPGYFRHALKVYGCQGKACVQCGGPIAHMRQAQRSSYFCPQCQPLTAD